MTPATAISLFLAGILGGVMNAVAGGGTFLVFPALLFTGMPPVPANATNTVALWPGIAASVRAFWPRLNAGPRVLIPLLLASLAGGVAGALLLLRTPAQTFMRLVPWLMLVGTLLFAFGGRLGLARPGRKLHEATRTEIACAVAFVLIVAIYGGYFGAGIGFLILAMLGALGMTEIHDMNALKILMVAVINGVAVVTFIAAHAVHWPQALVVLGGAVLGGYFGAHYSQRLPAAVLRGFVLLVGSGMTAYFFVHTF